MSAEPKFRIGDEVTTRIGKSLVVGGIVSEVITLRDHVEYTVRTSVGGSRVREDAMSPGALFRTGDEAVDRLGLRTFRGNVVNDLWYDGATWKFFTK